MLSEKYFFVPNVIWICVSLATENIFTAAEALDYKELQDVDVACSPMDTCINRFREDLEKEHSCGCTDQCVSQDNCCIDSPYLDQTLPKLMYHCTKVPHSQEIIQMVTNCNNRWIGWNHIKQLCESSTLLLGDPIEIVPVTNLFSQVTYKNYFCARCNHAQEGIVFWNVNSSSWHRTNLGNVGSVSGVNQAQELRTYCVVQYERHRNQWVCRYQNKTNNGDEIVPITLFISKPEHFKKVIPQCRYGIVRQCTAKWEGTLTKRKCETYTATVVVDWSNEDSVTHRRVFRNIHCAICNGVTNFTNTRCIPFKGSIDHIPPTTKTTVFPEIHSTITPVTSWFGHMLWDLKCLRKNEIYIERLGGCRTIICLNPTHIIRNRRCVPL